MNPSAEEAARILQALRAQANPANAAGMARYGIRGQEVLGVSIPALRALAKTYRRRRDLAQALWESGVHEARLLACFIDDPRQVSPEQMERWAADFDSWDLVDQCCSNLFDQTPYAWEKAAAWAARPQEFVKRAGFVLMASLAVHDQQSGDERFEMFFPLILREAGDERNFVKKAVNWALRGLGKRSPRLNERAVQVAREMLALDSRTARWNAGDALRELTSPAVQDRLARKPAG